MGRKIVKDENPDKFLCPNCKKEYVSREFYNQYGKCVVCYYDRHSHPTFFGDEELPESRKFFENKGMVYI